VFKTEAPAAVAMTSEAIQNAAHLSVDMQNIFDRGGIWETPWMERVLPNIVAIIEFNPPRTVLTRFIPPLSWEDRPGRWQRYFKKWECTTRSQLRASELEVVPSLARFAPPATIVDKPAYSAFAESTLANFLSNKGVDTLIVTGAETDAPVSVSPLARSASTASQCVLRVSASRATTWPSRVVMRTSFPEFVGPAFSVSQHASPSARPSASGRNVHFSGKPDRRRSKA
jgi:nicotinamidase-related amidase